MQPDDTRYSVARAVKHAANNMLMAAQGNLELMQRAAADERQQQRAERALLSMQALRQLIEAQTLLLRPAAHDMAEPAQVMQALMPVLEAVAKGRATIALEAPGAAPACSIARPDFELRVLVAVQAAVESGAVVCAVQADGVSVNGALVGFMPACISADPA